MNRKETSHLLEIIADEFNLQAADMFARRDKHNVGIVIHDKHKEKDIKELHDALVSLTYHTSEYDQFKLYEPKERIIFRLPYYPDRITHWAILILLEPIWVNKMISQTYSCIEGRGIHKCTEAVKKALKEDKEGTKYCLKLDVKKYYPSINHDVLKEIIRRTIKDKKLLTLLDGIIDSAEGIPIGNYLSQFFANLYLTGFDHMVKEKLRIKWYFRYMDDMVFLADSKEQLYEWKKNIDDYINNILKIRIKDTWQLFPVDSKGIDFVGYRFYHTHVLLRTSIKNRMLRCCLAYKNSKISREEFLKSIISYYGWLKHCNSKKLLQNIEKLTGVYFSNWNGKECSASKFNMMYKENPLIVEIVKHQKYFEIHFVFKNKSYTTKSSDKLLYNRVTNKEKIKVIDWVC